MGLKCVVLPLNLYYDLKKTMKHGPNVVSLDIICWLSVKL